MGDMGMWIQLVCVLVAVVALAYLVLHKGVGTVMRMAQKNKQIQIQERLALDHKRSLFIVSVDNRRFLLGGSADSALSLIAELDANLSPQVASPQHENS